MYCLQGRWLVLVCMYIRTYTVHTLSINGVYVRTKVIKVFRLLHVHVSLASTTLSINGVPEIALRVHAARALIVATVSCKQHKSPSSI